MFRLPQGLQPADPDTGAPQDQTELLPFKHSGNYVLVRHPDQVDAAIQDLSTSEYVGMDIEWKEISYLCASMHHTASHCTRLHQAVVPLHQTLHQS